MALILLHNLLKKQKIISNKIFEIANAEKYQPKQKFDVVTCMFSFHEMPEYAHNLIILNSLKIAKKEILILDISSNYKPTKVMLTGEPYLIEYLSSIDNTMSKYNFVKTSYIKNHADLWRLKI